MSNPISLILSIPLVRNIVGSLLMGSIFSFTISIVYAYYSTKIPWLTRQTVDYFIFCNMISLIFFPFFSIGKKIFTWIFLRSTVATVLYLILSVTNFYLIKIKVIDHKLYLGTVIFVIIAPIIMKIVSWRKKSNINLTMSEIDNFGVINGKKQTKLAGDLFEAYIRDLYRAIGYDANVAFDLKAAGKGPEGLKKLSGDGGGDVIAESQSLGERLVIQCKHYSNTVGVEACYQAAGALNNYKGTHAIVITNNFFTEEAIWNAKNNNILLIDRFQLTRLIADVSRHQEEQSGSSLFSFISLKKNKIKRNKVG